ncbi:DUF2797 domain-containing protein [Actinoallomurus purpureus]|uniref:DUF2797 domain-containing protein n=1 Tax=Actinoallomurus purpureus TaxID=478114 RepID=UPI0035577C5E
MEGTSVTDHPSAWRSTGLHWESAVPTLTASAHKANGPVPADREYARPVRIGQRIGWVLTGPRRCTGVWNGSRRIACPTATEVPEKGTDAQCPACAAGDRGRALARDATLGDDDRTYALYLAWFGAELLKVGLTAADRGRDRLLEQGAITAILLGTGPYTAVRRAERTIAASGLATERISARAKADAWWALPTGEVRARQVLDPLGRPSRGPLGHFVRKGRRWTRPSSTSAPTNCPPPPMREAARGGILEHEITVRATVRRCGGRSRAGNTGTGHGQPRGRPPSSRNC